MGLPILPHLLRQMPSHIVDYSGTTSSLHLRQPRQSLNLGKNNPSLNYPIYFLSHNFIRLTLTRAKPLQTVSRFPRETRRRYTASKSNAFTLIEFHVAVDMSVNYIYINIFLRSFIFLVVNFVHFMAKKMLGQLSVKCLK